jgi:Protein of unknown function (DUF2939)
MPLKAPAIILLLLAAGYAAAPCIALYRLHLALQAGDIRAIARLVDWSSVRSGLDEEIADAATDVSDPQAVSSGAELAPFGFGFTRAIASHTTQTVVTAPIVLQALRTPDTHGGYGVRLAYFTSPWQFVVQFAAPHRHALRVRLNLQEGQWRVTQVWVPPSMIREAAEHPTLQAAVN